MRERENIENVDNKFQVLVDNFLRNSDQRKDVDSSHLDQDTLAAFVEGNISQREATPIVAHLSDCGFCRNITSELVRLDMAFGEEAVVPVAANTSPSSVSEVMSSLFTRIFGSSGAEVFAHSEPDEEKKDKKISTEKEPD